MAHAYRATVLWQRGDQPFTDNKYTRGHLWRFDEGVEVPASSSPLVVPNYSVAAAVDPEQALVANRKSTRLNSSHLVISYAVFCLKKKKDRGRQNRSCMNN